MAQGRSEEQRPKVRQRGPWSHIQHVDWQFRTLAKEGESQLGLVRFDPVDKFAESPKRWVPRRHPSQSEVLRWQQRRLNKIEGRFTGNLSIPESRTQPGTCVPNKQTKASQFTTRNQKASGPEAGTDLPKR